MLRARIIEDLPANQVLDYPSSQHTALSSDPRKSSVLRARIIEDLIGRQVDETTIEIVKILSESDDESLSAISRSLLSEDGSFN